MKLPMIVSCSATRRLSENTKFIGFDAYFVERFFDIQRENPVGLEQAECTITRQNCTNCWVAEEKKLAHLEFSPKVYKL